MCLAAKVLRGKESKQGPEKKYGEVAVLMKVFAPITWRDAGARNPMIKF